MYYPRFTKAIIHHLITTDKSILMRNKMFMRTIRDDNILGTMRLVSKSKDFKIYEAKKTPSKAERSERINLLSEVALLEEAQVKKVLRRSRCETLIHQEGGSGDGTGSTPGVPDESKESWGDSRDEFNVHDDEEVQESDDEPQHDDDERTDSENQEANDDEDEFVHTPPNYVPTDDETNNESNDATQKTEGLILSYSISTDYAAKYLNFDNIPPVDTEFASMLDINVQHQVPRTSPLLTMHVSDGPFEPKTAKGDAKPESQWTHDERRVVVQDQRLKSIIISCLPYDIIESIISYVSAKETWTDLVHSFEGPLDTKENMIMDLKLKYQTFKTKSTKSLSQTYTCYKTLLNELSNDGVNLSKHKINVGFVNSILEKWLTFSQRLRNANHTQTLDFLDIFRRSIYEDNLIQRRYSDTKKALITTPSSTLISTAFFSNNVIQDFQENSNDEVDERSINNYSSVSKGFQPKFTQKLIYSSSNNQADLKFQKDYKVEYKKMKVKLALLEESPLSSQNPKSFQPKNKGLVTETFDWDEEEVTQVKVLMALTDDELTVRKNHAHNGEWVDITMR
uniref:Retrovirus-related Pol polyprotein from transposon TNT 1-94 n=1 Tax=Tanacetum cinerariifolium TaxID=118510 RepID=A0A6L2MTG9_TANCI|nr:retrovirus-related Pol polyprotein from transposon TNT 1-94 [Tanacetum cinerariifolium]GEU77281.1 retrovirus-related Pol polyprotein from transposon TNT 1-94 [Tanacetum cinerariifolium]